MPLANFCSSGKSLQSVIWMIQNRHKCTLYRAFDVQSSNFPILNVELPPINNINLEQVKKMTRRFVPAMMSATIEKNKNIKRIILKSRGQLVILNRNNEPAVRLCQLTGKGFQKSKSKVVLVTHCSPHFLKIPQYICNAIYMILWNGFVCVNRVTLDAKCHNQPKRDFRKINACFFIR